MREKRGLFICIEGIDGAGKSTQVSLLTKHIDDLDKYLDVIKTHEPWKNAEIKQKLNDDKDAYSNGLKLAELYTLDRSEHTKNLIVPSLRRGIFVISSRYSMSTLAYQWAQGIDLQKLLDLHRNRGILIPDLVFLFNLPVKEALKRLKKRGTAKDKFEKDAEFMKKLIEKYIILAKMAKEREGNLPFGKVVVINANQSIEKIHKDIKKAFDEVYEEWKNEQH